MSLTRIIALIVSFLIAMAIGWHGMLRLIPVIATDTLFDNFRANGLVENTLSPPRLRSTSRNVVPMDNADTLTRAAIINLADGPMIFEAVPAARADYWSISVFAHNTDTVFVENDEAIDSSKPFRLAVRKAGQHIDTSYDAEAVLPSDMGFLLVRATMADRTDTDYVNTLQDELRGHSLSAANGRQ